MTIVEFLDARIAEDEADAEGLRAWRPTLAARILAECAAKRTIVDAHRGQRYIVPLSSCTDLDIEYWHSDSELVEVRKGGHHEEYITGAEYLERVGATLEPPALELRALAAVYKAHPDYQQEWVHN